MLLRRVRFLLLLTLTTSALRGAEFQQGPVDPATHTTPSAGVISPGYSTDFWESSELSVRVSLIGDVSWLKTGPTWSADATTFIPASPIASSSSALPLPPAVTSILATGASLAFIKTAGWVRRGVRRRWARPD